MSLPEDTNLSSLPFDMQCEITRRVPLSYSDYLAMKVKGNPLLPCVEIISKPRRGMEKVKIPWRGIKSSNIRYIEEPYVLVFDHYDELMEMAQSRKLLEASIDIWGFVKKLHRESRVDTSLLEGKYPLTIQEYLSQESIFKREINNRTRLIAAFVNARVSRGVEEDYFFTFDRYVTLTPTSIDASFSVDSIGILLKGIIKPNRSFLEEYTGKLDPPILSLLLTYPNLTSLHLLEDVFLTGYNITPLLENGIERLTFDVNEDSLYRSRRNMTAATFSYIKEQGLFFPLAKAIQLPITTEEQLMDFERFFPNAKEIIFFYLYQGEIPSRVYRDYKYVMEFN